MCVFTHLIVKSRNAMIPSGIGSRGSGIRVDVPLIHLINSAVPSPFSALEIRKYPSVHFLLLKCVSTSTQKRLETNANAKPTLATANKRKQSNQTSPQMWGTSFRWKMPSANRANIRRAIRSLTVPSPYTWQIVWTASAAVEPLLNSNRRICR